MDRLEFPIRRACGCVPTRPELRPPSGKGPFEGFLQTPIETAFGWDYVTRLVGMQAESLHRSLLARMCFRGPTTWDQECWSGHFSLVVIDELQELANHLGIDRGRLTRLLTKLEDEGLVSTVQKRTGAIGFPTVLRMCAVIHERGVYQPLRGLTLDAADDPRWIERLALEEQARERERVRKMFGKRPRAAKHRAMRGKTPHIEKPMRGEVLHMSAAKHSTASAEDVAAQDVPAPIRHSDQTLRSDEADVSRASGASTAPLAVELKKPSPRSGNRTADGLFTLFQPQDTR